MVLARAQIAVILCSIALLASVVPASADNPSGALSGNAASEAEPSVDASPIVPPVKRVAPQMPDNKAKLKSKPVAKAQPKPGT